MYDRHFWLGLGYTAALTLITQALCQLNSADAAAVGGVYASVLAAYFATRRPA